jgi:predicted transposase/invertase (TIGR01784 family)
LFNESKAFSHQIGKGKEFSMLAPVYSLNIINQSFSSQQHAWYHHYKLTHQSLPNRFMHGIEFILVELPNFIPSKFSEKKLTTLWLRFLNDIENRTTMIPEELLEIPEIAEAVEALKVSSYSLEELEKYDKYWDIISTQKTMLIDAWNDGERHGEKRGEKRGEKKGEKKGEKRGLMLAAKNLKAKNFPLEEICKITGLSPDEVKNL